MRISEPMTMVTDYLVTAVALVLGMRLLRVPSGPARLLGGTRHGFAPALDPAVVRALWKTTVLAVGLASFLRLAGAARASLTRTAGRWLAAANAVKLAAYVAWMATHDDFRHAVLDYVVAMAVVLVLQLHDLRRGRAAAARWIVPGLYRGGRELRDTASGTPTGAPARSTAR